MQRHTGHATLRVGTMVGWRRIAAWAVLGPSDVLWEPPRLLEARLGLSRARNEDKGPTRSSTRPGPGKGALRHHQVRLHRGVTHSCQRRPASGAGGGAGRSSPLARNGGCRVLNLVCSHSSRMPSSVEVARSAARQTRCPSSPSVSIAGTALASDVSAFSLWVDGVRWNSGGDGTHTSRSGWEVEHAWPRLTIELYVLRSAVGVDVFGRCRWAAHKVLLDLEGQRRHLVEHAGLHQPRHSPRSSRRPHWSIGRRLRARQGPSLSVGPRHLGPPCIGAAGGSSVLDRGGSMTMAGQPARPISSKSSAL